MSDPFSSDELISRRNLLQGASAGGLGMLMGASALADIPAPKLNINFSDPAQNLQAYMRVFTDINPDKVAYGWFGGTVYAVIGDTQKTIPLLGIEGLGIARTQPQAGGSFRVFNRELAFYKDLRTGEFIDTWTNPLNNRKVDVFPIHNMTVNAEVAPVLKMDIEGKIIEQPFNPPWKILGDHVFSDFEIHASVPSELKPDVWALESSGPLTRISEMFTRICRTADLANEKLTSVPYVGSWFRLGSWFPWMLMGQTEGHLMFRTDTTKFESLNDLPAKLLAKAQKDFPAYLEAPSFDSWGKPNDSTFNMYRKERKPQPVS